jgi:microcompartment protein CcmL/EutN
MADVPAPPPIPPGSALGMVETFGLVAAIEAADAMLKAADVRLVRKHRVDPGMISHVVVGETAAVQAAVDAGAAAAGRLGKVVGTLVIPRPSDDVWRRMLGVTLTTDAPPASAPRAARPVAAPRPAVDPPAEPTAAPPEGAVPASAPPDRDYDAMTVRELRAVARDRPDLALRGRAVATASKDDLVAQLRAADAR